MGHKKGDDQNEAATKHMISLFEWIPGKPDAGTHLST